MCGWHDEGLNVAERQEARGRGGRVKVQDGGGHMGSHTGLLRRSTLKLLPLFTVSFSSELQLQSERRRRFKGSAIGWARRARGAPLHACVYPPLSAGLRGDIKLTHLRAALLYLYPPWERGAKLYNTAPPAGYNPDAQQCLYFLHSCFGLIDAIMCLY